jgi:hypothetical protein
MEHQVQAVQLDQMVLQELPVQVVNLAQAEHQVQAALVELLVQAVQLDQMGQAVIQVQAVLQ